MIHFPELYVLRHAETEWNEAGRLQGGFDSALTARGNAQAQAQQQILTGRTLQGFRAFTSPQGRAAHTAQIALQGLDLPVTQDEALREIGLGEWAGEDRKALISKHGAADGFELYALAPGGEGFAALEERCRDFLTRLEGPAVLITHGITSRMIRLIVTGHPAHALRDMPGGQGVVFHLKDGIQKRLTLGA